MKTLRQFILLIVIVLVGIAVFGCKPDPVHEHQWSAWTQTKAPTATAEGEETRTCSTCGEKETRPVAKLPEEVPLVFRGVWEGINSPLLSTSKSIGSSFTFTNNSITYRKNDDSYTLSNLHFTSTNNNLPDTFNGQMYPDGTYPPPNNYHSEDYPTGYIITGDVVETTGFFALLYEYGYDIYDNQYWDCPFTEYFRNYLF